MGLSLIYKMESPRMSPNEASLGIQQGVVAMVIMVLVFLLFSLHPSLDHSPLTTHHFSIFLSFYFYMLPWKDETCTYIRIYTYITHIYRKNTRDCIERTLHPVYKEHYILYRVLNVSPSRLNTSITIHPSHLPCVQSPNISTTASIYHYGKA